MATHDIYIYPEGKSKTSGIQIPWLPEEIEVDMGELRVLEYNILDQGPVHVPNGSNLGAIRFSSIFPGTNRTKAGLPFLRGSLKDPKNYTKQLDYWKQNGTKLKVIVTGTNINSPVYVRNFTYKHAGGFGDISYELSLETRRDIKITTIKPSAKPKNKPKSPTKATPTTYTIKKGDTLWGISSKYLGKGSRWKEIYTLNKSIIESTAKKYGKKSSDGGHWIYPGCKLKIPKK